MQGWHIDGCERLPWGTSSLCHLLHPVLVCSKAEWEQACCNNSMLFGCCFVVVVVLSCGAFWKEKTKIKALTHLHLPQENANLCYSAIFSDGETLMKGVWCYPEYTMEAMLRGNIQNPHKKQLLDFKYKEYYNIFRVYC